MGQAVNFPLSKVTGLGYTRKPSLSACAGPGAPCPPEPICSSSSHLSLVTTCHCHRTVSSLTQGTVLFTTGSSRGIPGFLLSRCAAEVACHTNPVFMVDLYMRVVEFLFQGATEDAICLHVTVLTHLWALPGPSSVSYLGIRA